VRPSADDPLLPRREIFLRLQHLVALQMLISCEPLPSRRLHGGGWRNTWRGGRAGSPGSRSSPTAEPLAFATGLRRGAICAKVPTAAGDRTCRHLLFASDTIRSRPRRESIARGELEPDVGRLRSMPGCAAPPLARHLVLEGAPLERCHTLVEPRRSPRSAARTSCTLRQYRDVGRCSCPGWTKRASARHLR